MNTDPQITEVDLLHREPLAVDMLIRSLELYADRTAVHIGDEQLTYRQVRDQISKFAQAYASLGLGIGSPVAILSANRPEVLFTQGANAVTGVRFAALHPMGSLDDHAYVLQDAGIETLIYDPDKYEQRAAQLAERVPGLKNLLAFGPTEAGTDLLATAEAFEPAPLVAPDVAPGDTVSLAYTGGTTGKSKGVMLSFRGGATLLRIQMTEWQWPQEVRFLVCTPLSHAGGAFWNPTSLQGGSIVVLPGFDPATVLATIEKYRITSTMLVPTMLYALLDYPDLDKYDLSSLETVFYGASAISPTRLAEAIEKFGPIFFQFYGQAECPMTISVLRKEDHDPAVPERLASCGRPVPWLHVALLDDAGNEVPTGEPGEICVRGPLVMKGYLNKPEQTAEATEHDWLHTGDIARRDADGFLYIVDRKKDMIVTGGFNVYPREVEDVLSAHPAVSAAAVIGVPDDKWGEAVKAVVVLRAGREVAVEELQALVKERKGAVYTPKSIDFADSIPLSPLGKPDKKALRAQYWSDGARQVN
ncbi:AMP-binding protein [Nocardia cyriacigeorgica]|uniref:AMP-binding protein n=1 Tax=Nocardia cyriacigeorgica TaxID=135487 RepID=UPI0018946B1B|nr:AMP-binding protein [Nocardia cyriacigeorgica]MBF6098147.1 AMP-binding protein [Nocardia cyriacigeorgica]MBF6157806.1 AMP-binding protein [Nocardia cyriacigeorgica]MBF6196778.1 AMP-binding protein [Nocardia cyriacigeorgica]MBF6317962.1 AMP-binding protein [Nocardia cyriacigeorgica]MBF6343908.1 AMP-binding protein [Nocardia cyriacigeorgica]